MDSQELQQPEDDLWEAANQLRANSKPTASEYSMLHHAHIVQIGGESYRLRDKRRAGQAAARKVASA